MRVNQPLGNFATSFRGLTHLIFLTFTEICALIRYSIAEWCGIFHIKRKREIEKSDYYLPNNNNNNNNNDNNNNNNNNISKGIEGSRLTTILRIKTTFLSLQDMSRQ